MQLGVVSVCVEALHVDWHCSCTYAAVGFTVRRGVRFVRAGVAGVAGVSYIKPKRVLYSSIKKFDESDNLQ